MNSRPTVGSVLQLMPASGSVHCAVGDAEWNLPMIGYAVVVTWVEEGDPVTEYGAPTVETSVEPVVLGDEGTPEAMTSYRSWLKDPTLLRWRVVL